MKRLLVVYLGLVLLMGCVGLRTQPQTAKLITQYATLKFVEKAPDQEARKQRIRDVLVQLKGVTDTASTLAALKAKAMVAEVAGELEARMGAGTISSENLVQVLEVFSWIEEVVR